MTDTPAWWLPVTEGVARRRQYTGMLLARSTPTQTGSTLRLRFSPADTRAWHDSGSQRILDAALQHHGIDVAVEVGGETDT